jgi:hypothetical protein
MPLDGDHYLGDGRVYEVFFWLEDVQEIYEMELWCGLNEDDLKKGVSGTYTDDLSLAIELLGPPVVGATIPDEVILDGGEEEEAGFRQKSTPFRTRKVRQK